MERHCKMLIALTFSLVALLDERAVTYGQECIAPPPCECTTISLDCGGRHLSKIPVLAAAVGQEYEYLTFRDNEIQSIDDDSFAGVRPVDNTLDILLENNHLSHISPAAFRGLENVSVSLNLNGNNLTELPKALVHLQHLRELSMWGLKSFDPEVMTVIGKSLEDLYTGFDGTWPVGLNLATNLKRIYVDNSNIKAFPIFNKTSIFTTLRAFQLYHSVVNETLDIICHMPVLGMFEVVDVKFPSNIPVLAPCANSVESVRDLMIINSSVSNYSDILRSFPSLTTITIRETGLNELILPTLNHIDYLDLISNKLINLPATDGQSLPLTGLHMKNNLVQVIHAHDLRPFPDLKTIDLSHNPITRIESGAFLHNKALTYVDLSSTSITSIPIMSKPLDRVMLNFKESPIQCSCAMKWMYPLPYEEFVSGRCANKSMSIADFIKIELRQCQSPFVIG